MGKNSEFAAKVRRRYQKALKREKKAKKEMEYFEKKLKKAKRVHRKIDKEIEILAESCFDILWILTNILAGRFAPEQGAELRSEVQALDINKLSYL